VLAYADEVTEGVRAKKATFKRLGKFLSEQEIVELTLTIGFYGMVARFLEALEVDVDRKRFRSG
jgi:4-carboxymuconolactone decarboxylase